MGVLGLVSLGLKRYREWRHDAKNTLTSSASIVE